SWHSVRHKNPSARQCPKSSSIDSICSLSTTNRSAGRGPRATATGARATGGVGRAGGVRAAGTAGARRFSHARAPCDPAHLLPLARAVKDAGWDGFIVPDSICYPEVSDTKYPYPPDGNREFIEGKPFIEPFSLIPAMGAVTSRLRFTTFVVKLPIRQPLLVANSLA